MALIKFESSMWIPIHSCANTEFTDFILYQLETKRRLTIPYKSNFMINL